MMSQTLGPDENYQFKWSMLAMVGFGVGEVFGGFFIGFIVDRYGTKTAILCNLVSILLMNGVTLAFIYQFKFNALPWIMCFLWGFQDSGTNTQI
jgi:predicted MFS family arabinose efflux permease